MYVVKSKPLNNNTKLQNLRTKKYDRILRKWIYQAQRNKTIAKISKYKPTLKTMWLFFIGCLVSVKKDLLYISYLH